MLVEKAISWPLGDQDGPMIPRVKKRSSMGTGPAPSSVCEVRDVGSVISRVSGESEAKTVRAISINRLNARRLTFIDNPRRSPAAREFCGMRIDTIVETQTPRTQLLAVPHNLRILCGGIQTAVFHETPKLAATLRIRERARGPKGSRA